MGTGYEINGVDLVDKYATIPAVVGDILHDECRFSLEDFGYYSTHDIEYVVGGDRLSSSLRNVTPQMVSQNVNNNLKNIWGKEEISDKYMYSEGGVDKGIRFTAKDKCPAIYRHDSEHRGVSYDNCSESTISVFIDGQYVPTGCTMACVHLKWMENGYKGGDPGTYGLLGSSAQGNDYEFWTSKRVIGLDMISAGGGGGTRGTSSDYSTGGGGAGGTFGSFIIDVSGLEFIYVEGGKPSGVEQDGGYVLLKVYKKGNTGGLNPDASYKLHGGQGAIKDVRGVGGVRYDLNGHESVNDWVYISNIVGGCNGGWGYRYGRQGDGGNASAGGSFSNTEKLYTGLSDVGYQILKTNGYAGHGIDVTDNHNVFVIGVPIDKAGGGGGASVLGGRYFSNGYPIPCGYGTGGNGLYAVNVEFPPYSSQVVAATAGCPGAFMFYFDDFTDLAE